MFCDASRFNLQPRSIVTPSATLLDKAKEPWPPPRIPKGQSLAARVLIIDETSFAAMGWATHHGSRAALKDQYVDMRSEYSVVLG